MATNASKPYRAGVGRHSYGGALRNLKVTGGGMYACGTTTPQITGASHYRTGILPENMMKQAQMGRNRE